MNQIKIVALTLGFLAVLLAYVSVSEAEESEASMAPAAGNRLFYVGTYTGAKSKGIYLCRLDIFSGKLSMVGLATETPNPTFIVIDYLHQFLYAANEIGDFEGKSAGSVSAYSITAGTGKLNLLNTRSTVGGGPCHIVLGGPHKDLLVANYGGGSLTVLPIQRDGRLEEASDFIRLEGKSINPDRQEKPHTHCITIDALNRFAFACDLGLDKIMIYHFDWPHGKLTPNDPPFVSIKPGSGPRHLTLSVDNRHAYLINELNSTINVFDCDTQHGVLKEIQTISTLPADFSGPNAAAEIALSFPGNFLYASNRGDNSIVVYSVDHKSGMLTLIQRQTTFGKTPRHFEFDPSRRFLIAANQDSDTLVVFKVDQVTGKLMSTGQALEVPSPACIKF